MQWARRQTGFTIVELLIVIVIIAVLASVTVVAYTGIQQRANSSQQLSTVENWQKVLLTASTQGLTVSDGADPVCLGRTTDYPAQDGFTSGQCLSVRGDGVSIDALYNASTFSGWTNSGTLPSGKMPTKLIVDSSSGIALTYKARGVWLVGPVSLASGGVQLAWIPQEAGKCGAGTVTGGLCLLGIRF